ncbi:hypothetical protein F7725_021373 [Dissostichus mawsoni]|uniref:Paraneoplastic antigen Ma-like C-terminal domain-containing protein n=1 Tax=Dissostichus mawsoni TaxID=36200 RepID=A0A7J5ZB05_DISMA|nr:hypothetical protein F7725_021373 [Dissostichus mawsoni]
MQLVLVFSIKITEDVDSFLCFCVWAEKEYEVDRMSVHLSITSGQVRWIDVNDVIKELQNSIQISLKGLQCCLPACPSGIRQLLELQNTLSRIQRLLAFHQGSMALWGAIAKSISFLHNVEECDKMRGNAKREMRLLDPDQLSSSIAILQELKRLYGRVTPVAQLRAQFFKCYQQEEETAASFLLRLRELFHQWEEVEPAGSAQDERTIRDQLVLGLRPGMVQQELQRQVRRNPTMSFREVSGEVKALETELRMESACASRVSVPQPRPAMAPSSLEEWRETVRTELRKEMKDQLSIITETLTEEIRRQLSPQNAPVGHRDSTPPLTD